MNLEKCVNEAGMALLESQKALKDVQVLLDDEDWEDGGSVQGSQILSLILQYRLDTQKALEGLLQVDHGIMQILGINPHHSERINIERMAFALGQEDLKQILHALSQLVDVLLKAAYRIENRSRLNPHHVQQQKYQSMNRIMALLKKAIKKQDQFISELNDINHNLVKLTKRGPIGPVLDHIHAIKGPISQFFQAIQNGLGLSHQLYLKVNKGASPNFVLSKAFQQAEDLLVQIPALYESNPVQFKLSKPSDTETLEQRAAKRRLGHFFRH